MRKSKGITQQQLAERLGVTKSVISAYESGIRKPSYDILIKISRIYGVTTDYLLGLDNDYRVNTKGLSEDDVSLLILLADKFRNNKEASSLDMLGRQEYKDKN